MNAQIDIAITEDQDKSIARTLSDLSCLLAGMDKVIGQDWDDIEPQRDLLRAGFMRAQQLIGAAQEELPHKGDY